MWYIMSSQEKLNIFEENYQKLDEKLKEFFRLLIKDLTEIHSKAELINENKEDRAMFKKKN